MIIYKSSDNVLLTNKMLQIFNINDDRYQNNLNPTKAKNFSQP